jgi:hypothetical protein
MITLDIVQTKLNRAGRRRLLKEVVQLCFLLACYSKTKTKQTLKSLLGHPLLQAQKAIEIVLSFTKSL